MILGWIVFHLIILLGLFIDLNLNRGKALSIKDALLWTGIWVFVAVCFGLGLGVVMGHESAYAFFGAYLVEKALSVDNLFVFSVIFAYFKAPNRIQHKALVWGIIGAVILRGCLILMGASLVSQFQWILYIFGAILVFTGTKILRGVEEEFNVAKNPVYRFVTYKCHFSTFLTLLLMVEITDLIFAFDSIPAALAISQDSFIVYTSNLLAVLGLRSLYFALLGALDKFEYLQTGVASILIFIGLKILVAHWVPVPMGISLLTITGILVLSVIASVLKERIWDAKNN